VYLKFYCLLFCNITFKVKAKSVQDHPFLRPDWVSSKKFLNTFLIFHVLFLCKFCSMNLISYPAVDFWVFPISFFYILVELSHNYILLVLTLIY
jgi:hypothetical protein